MDKRFLGSSVALVIGSIAIIAGLSSPSSTMFVGTSAIISALAYRSAKKRNLGLVQSSSARKAIEIAGLGFMILLLITQKNYSDLLYVDPVPYLIVPLWGLIAYFVMFFKSNPKNNFPVTETEDDYVWACKYCSRVYKSEKTCAVHEKTHKRKRVTT